MGAQWKVINQNYKNLEGYKRVAWPPASEERIVREFTPQPQTQYSPAPAYTPQQQHQPSPFGNNAATAPPAQYPSYNNVQHQAPNSSNANTSLARETNTPYNQNPNDNEYEAFPPQTPETPIILKDKQFSKLPSHEPNQTNSVPYQHYQQQQQQQQHQQYQQPQNPQYELKQQHYNQEQLQYQQPLYNQQKQQHYQPNQQNVAYHQHEQQNYQPRYQDEHQQQASSNWKPIRPPQTKQNTIFTGACGVREITPTVSTPTNQQHYQNYQQQQQYRAPSFDNYQQPLQHQQQKQQFSPQPQYQAQAPTALQNQYQPQAGSHYQQTPLQQQPAWTQQQANQQQQQEQYQQPPWVQQQQQPQYQNPLNQYNQAPHQQQQQQYHPPSQQNQFVPQTNQQQFNSYSQPQQQQHTVSHDQVDQQHHLPHLSQDQRGASPGIITLRKEAPITQKPAPVFTSQPAAVSYRESSTDDSLGGSNMRGDLKWPPPEYKEAAAKENEERRQLALSPACRPRKVHRDYTQFFAKNALSHHYPSYKVPPGTQHMIN